MNVTNPSVTKKPIRQALEDAATVGISTGVAALITTGYPPEMEGVYMAFLAAAMVAVTSYARARRIQNP